MSNKKLYSIVTKDVTKQYAPIFFNEYTMCNVNIYLCLHIYVGYTGREGNKKINTKMLVITTQ